jgi:hypothetical protein
MMLTIMQVGPRAAVFMETEFDEALAQSDALPWREWLCRWLSRLTDAQFERMQAEMEAAGTVGVALILKCGAAVYVLGNIDPSMSGSDEPASKGAPGAGIGPRARRLH